MPKVDLWSACSTYAYMHTCTQKSMPAPAAPWWPTRAEIVLHLKLPDSCLGSNSPGKCSACSLLIGLPPVRLGWFRGGASASWAWQLGFTY